MLTYDACVKYSKEEHFCPHCNTRLSCCETPPFHIGDGLGWGADVMFICLNNECPIYAKGWKNIENQYGHVGSYRYMQLPGETKGELLMVATEQAFTGSIIDPEAMRKQNIRYQKEKEAVKALETCVDEHDLEPVLALLLDECASLDNRMKACTKLVPLNDLTCIDPLRNHKFVNGELEMQTNMAITEILNTNFKKECPACAEIIKKQAKVCKHCKKEC